MLGGMLGGMPVLGGSLTHMLTRMSSRRGAAEADARQTLSERVTRAPGRRGPRPAQDTAPRGAVSTAWVVGCRCSAVLVAIDVRA